MPPLTLTAAVVTWRRPDALRTCLDHLDTESDVLEVIVVDASSDPESAAICRDHPGVVYVPFPGGAGHMTRSRNVALARARGDVLAFLDDDAFVEPGWAAAVLAAFADPEVGAAAGRTINPGDPDEERDPAEVGRLRPDGTLAANFHTRAPAPFAVEHGIGANMSFRRAVLDDLGGLRDDYPGTALREDTDAFLRVGAAGWRVLFLPDAQAIHIGAPHVKGRRFDYRYQFWARHNHLLLLTRNLGWGSPVVRRWLAHALRHLDAGSDSSPARHVLRVVMGLAALVAGIGTSLVKARWRPLPPARR